MTTPMLPAQMSNSGGRWHLYVPLTGEEWPAHDWSPTAPVPTLAERARVLAGLGYAVAGEWTWIEDSEVYGDPTTTVRLIATATVRAAATDPTTFRSGGRHGAAL
ncbi:DUF6303 family protein [Streptomyces sp. NPDC008125]|uniref:DUF6303 family protein n=1 Tax=Streptomyces sp. NPDC008125 TaxID=3364811 RepID=UPI0036EBD324